MSIWTKEVGHPDQKFGHFTYSQHGEDLFILNLFKLLGIEKGTYLDIGAHHPLNISNTALLYERGWRGVNVEANIYLIAEFMEYRPEDINLNFGIDSKEGSKFLFMYDETSGRNTFSEKERDSFLKDYPCFQVRTEKQVRMITINFLIDAYCFGKWPDFINIDAEGLDYEIINSIQFPDHFTNRPHVFCVEVRNEDTERFKYKMGSLGYTCLTRIISNLIFIRNDHLGLVR